MTVLTPKSEPEDKTMALIANVKQQVNVQQEVLDKLELLSKVQHQVQQLHDLLGDDPTDAQKKRKLDDSDSKDDPTDAQKKRKLDDSDSKEPSPQEGTAVAPVTLTPSVMEKIVILAYNCKFQEVPELVRNEANAIAKKGLGDDIEGTYPYDRAAINLLWASSVLLRQSFATGPATRFSHFHEPSLERLTEVIQFCQDIAALAS